MTHREQTMSDNSKKTKDVTITKAKGRPMLTWVGKKPLSRVTAYPAQGIERFDAPGERMPGFYAGYFRDPDGNKLAFFHMG